MVHTAHAAVVHLAMVHLAVLWSFVLHRRLIVARRMCAVIAMPHVLHAQLRTGVGFWYRRAQPLANGQGAAGEAAAVH